jgi:hypothetical protein
MSTLTGLIQALKTIFSSQTTREEDYLARSVDVCDLERRMHVLDQVRSINASGFALQTLMP